MTDLIAKLTADLKTCDDRIAFNTGRQYAANGQPIIAVRIGNIVTFKDEARMIVGTFNLPADQALTASAVMAAYDGNAYRMAVWMRDWN